MKFKFTNLIYVNFSSDETMAMTAIAVLCVRWNVMWWSGTTSATSVVRCTSSRRKTRSYSAIVAGTRNSTPRTVRVSTPPLRLTSSTGEMLLHTVTLLTMIRLHCLVASCFIAVSAPVSSTCLFSIVVLVHCVLHKGYTEKCFSEVEIETNRNN